MSRICIGLSTVFSDGSLGDVEWDSVNVFLGYITGEELGDLSYNY